MHPVFVMIKCELGRAYEVANYIVENIEETSEVYSISGQFDLLVKFYVAEDADIGHFVCDKLHATPHLKDTFTLDTFNAFTG